MEVTPRTLLEYVSADGKIPFREWLNKLRDIQARAKIRVRLNRVRLGNLSDSKSVGNGVYELRISFGPGYRVYFAEDCGHIILLLCGGDKSSQKKDIERAKSYWADYREKYK